VYGAKAQDSSQRAESSNVGGQAAVEHREAEGAAGARTDQQQAEDEAAGLEASFELLELEEAAGFQQQQQLEVVGSGQQATPVSSPAALLHELRAAMPLRCPTLKRSSAAGLPSTEAARACSPRSADSRALLSQLSLLQAEAAAAMTGDD
jgi:hypothetical protein